MGRNAQRRRARRDASLEARGREVRTTVAERIGARIRSVVRQVVGSDAQPPSKPKTKGSPMAAAAMVTAATLWGAPARGRKHPAVTSDPDPRQETHS